MLETAEERVKLLKTGASGKEIEMLYIEHNNFKIIRTPILCEAKEFDRAHSILDNEGYFDNPQITSAFALKEHNLCYNIILKSPLNYKSSHSTGFLY